MIHFHYADHRAPGYVTGCTANEPQVRVPKVLPRSASKRYRTEELTVAVATALRDTEGQVHTHRRRELSDRTAPLSDGGATGVGGDWLARMDAQA
jgi:hypothetical protein